MSKKFLTVALISFVALLLVACALLLALLLGQKDRYTPTVSLNGENAENSQKSVLILGKDKASGLFDVIMLAAIDEDNSSACIMQIPRDTYAEYVKSGYRKINAAPKILGEEGFCEFLSENMGIDVQGYISFELDAFGKAVDLIGGVEMTLPRALDYNDPEQGLYIHLPKGTQVLDGEKAQMLVRFRKGYIRGDLDRLDVQKKFMAAFFCKVKDTVNILNAYGFASELLPYIKTNMSASTLVSLGLKALTVDTDKMGFLTLPGEDAREDGGASYYVMSGPSANEVMEKYFGKKDGSFDSNGAFLNEKSQSFSKIYNKKYEYSVTFAKDMQ